MVGINTTGPDGFIRRLCEGDDNDDDHYDDKEDGDDEDDDKEVQDDGINEWKSISNVSRNWRENNYDHRTMG